MEVSTTITMDQIRRLPSLDRSPLALVRTQAGVTNGRANTIINGQRTSFSNVTLDGVNIQDNFLRDNALDFLPNLLLLDQVAEVTVATSNASAANGGGSSQVIFSDALRRERVARRTLLVESQQRASCKYLVQQPG